MKNYKNEEIVFNGCPGCAYANHEFTLPCGMAYENERSRGHIVNLGSGKEISMKAVVEEICAYFDYKGEIEYRPGRPADVQRLCADARLARELLGFEPEVDFPTGLRETLDWYKVNQQ